MTEAEPDTFFEGYGAAFTQTARDISAFYHARITTALLVDAAGRECDRYHANLLEAQGTA